MAGHSDICTHTAWTRESIAHYYPEASWPTRIWTSRPWTLCQSADEPVLASTLNLTQHYYDWQYHEHMNSIKRCVNDYMHTWKAWRRESIARYYPEASCPTRIWTLNAPALDPLSVGRRTDLSFNPKFYTALLWLTASWTHEQHQEVWPSLFRVQLSHSSDIMQWQAWRRDDRKAVMIATIQQAPWLKSSQYHLRIRRGSLIRV